MSVKTYMNLALLYLNSKTRFKFLLPKRVYPFRANIRLTENCNSKCITCNYWEKNWEDKISTQEAIDIVNSLKMLGLERCRFTGGEPFLRKDFFQILDAIRPGDFKKVTVATNGLHLKKLADNVNKSSITDLGVSIDGLRATNDKIRGIDGCFDLVFEGVRMINKRVTVMTTLLRNNAYELEELFNICEENGLLWDFNLLDNRLFFLEGTNLKLLWPDEKSVDHILNTIQRNLHRPVLARISHLQLEYTERYLKRLPINEPPCYLGYTDIDIDSAGNFWTGCNVLPPIGNVLKDSLRELLQSEAYFERLEKMRRRQCPGCTCGYEFNVSIEQLPMRAFYYLLGQGRK